jgi:hypothetical protein
MDKVLDGDLARFSVPDVLTLLGMGQRTGVLVLERAGGDRFPGDGPPAATAPDYEETKLFIRDGRPVFAVATRDDLRLGNMLVRMGRLAQADLDRILGRQQGGMQRLGEVLQTEKVVSEAELGSFLKVQVSEVIFDTFSWRVGSFTFYDNVQPPNAVVTLEMDLQNLIIEGVRRLDERVRLEEVFPDRQMSVEVLANPERVKHSVTLIPEEWQVFFLVDGQRTISEICRLVGNPDELFTLRVLNRLLVAKFVALVAQREGEAAPPTSYAKAPAPEDKGQGTQFSVEFRQAPPKRSVEDDTHEIVSPKAIGYQAGAQQVTVSRLILVKDGKESSFPLTKDSYTIGRHKNNDIVISNPKVSSFHARIDRGTNGFMLVDLKSRNGSWVNGKKIENELLKTGDEVRLGPAKLTYKVDYQSPVA